MMHTPLRYRPARTGPVVFTDYLQLATNAGR
jgi:hypothetical protein